MAASQMNRAPVDRSAPIRNNHHPVVQSHAAAVRGKKARILFTSFAPLPFVRIDEKMLQERYEVKSIYGAWLAIAYHLVRSLFSVDLAFCWFATVSATLVAALGRLMHKPVVIVVGGIDVARVPELGYGAFVNPWRARLARFAIRRADRVLIVDPSLGRDIKANVGHDLKNVRYLPTGYDTGFWRPAALEKEEVVLTVAWCPDETRIRLKGIDTFIRVAARVPSAQFWVVGVFGPAARELEAAGLPGNVKLFNPVPHARLLGYYQKAKVYCQLSMREGLPNAVCEAMLCGCIPVGTRRGGIPTAIGRTGLLVEYGDVDQTAEAILKALRMGPARVRSVRRRIADNFPKVRRRAALFQLVDNLLEI